MDKCAHEFQYQGTVYWTGSHPRPGSGAYDRIYGDRYFCQKCEVKGWKAIDAAMNAKE